MPAHDKRQVLPCLSQKESLVRRNVKNAVLHLFYIASVLISMVGVVPLIIMSYLSYAHLRFSAGVILSHSAVVPPLSRKLSHAS